MSTSGRRRRGTGFVLLTGTRLVGVLSLLAAAGARGAETAEQARLRAELSKLPYRIVYESFRSGNWDLRVMNADGSGAASLTDTSKVHEMYPHASPDGRRVCFVADEGQGKMKTRNVHVLDIPPAGSPAGKAAAAKRTLVARNARQPCWGPDSRTVAYAKGEYERFTYTDYATKGVRFLDLATGKYRDHPNAKLHHLYNLCWSPCGKWFAATVHGGMGFKHANLAFPADGTEVHKLPHVGGCRPDFSPDGGKICWNAGDQLIAVADVDLSASPPRVTNVRKAVTCAKTHEVYHPDWSPDGRFLAFSYGPKGGEQVGHMAKDWHICVADASRKDVWVVLTSDGVSNKEPDWVPAGVSSRPRKGPAPR